MALRVKKGDRVLVIAGKDKGKKGKILKIEKIAKRVIVEGVNLTKRHSRPTQKNPQGGIIQREASIDVSNVQVVCPSCGLPTRIGIKITDKGKVRVCKKCNTEVK